MANLLRKQYAKLSLCNKDIVRKMLQYFAFRPVNEPELKAIQLKLVETALENQEKGVPLRNVFGENLQKYCDDTLKNVKRATIGEQVMNFLFYAFVLLSVYTPLLYIYALININDFTIDGAFLYTNWGEVFFPCIIGFQCIIYIFILSRRSFKPLIQTIAIYFIYIVISSIKLAFICYFLSDFYVSLNIPLLFVVFSFCGFVSYYLKNRLAKKNYYKMENNE